jgi:hypothetical protein
MTRLEHVIQTGARAHRVMLSSKLSEVVLDNCSRRTLTLRCKIVNFLARRVHGVNLAFEAYLAHQAFNQPETVKSLYSAKRVLRCLRTQE